MTQAQISHGTFENTKWVIEYPLSGERNVREVFTTKEIVDNYYDYWSKRMLETGKLLYITESNCINDWIVINWAYEL